jgi:tripartite ATP-independent transporter DctM subunit
MIVLLFLIMFLLMGFAFTMWTAMGISSLAYMLIRGEIPLNVLASSMVEGVEDTSLVAIPLFILAGELMNRSGITKQLAELVDIFVGRFKGGLAYVAIVVNIILAGVSGSAIADASAVSSVMLPTMKERGYDKEFSAAINAAAAVVGPIIPPSIPMIFIGVISGISIGKLFLGGVIPGLLMSSSMAVVVFILCKRRNYPVTKTPFKAKIVFPLIKNSTLAVIAPLVIILGIILGIVTLVEVSVLANVYILFIALLVYKSLKMRELPKIITKAALFSSTLMILFAIASLFKYISAYEQLGEKLALFIADWHMSKYTYLLLVNIFLLFMGCIEGGIPIMLIFFPVLLPPAIKLGIDPTHFGVIVVMNLMIGLLTPPVGGLLFLQTKMAEIDFDVLVRHVWPYIICLVTVLLLCTYIPELVLFIPNLVLG